MYWLISLHLLLFFIAVTSALPLNLPYIRTTLQNTSEETLSLPRPQHFHIPNTNLFITFSRFYHEIEPEDAISLLQSAVEDATREQLMHGPNLPISLGLFDVDEPPLEFLLRGTSEATPTYQEVLFLAHAMQSYFPIPEHLGGVDKYWACRFEFWAPRPAGAMQVAHGAIGYLRGNNLTSLKILRTSDTGQYSVRGNEGSISTGISKDLGNPSLVS